ncbi:hypothetical protein V498_09191 [Pseudogymnoascus sp. VKM F-4517 (FW-2822)]|nr:hypothetical protein V498_09191 [Pseudogymnoascus sp. VKM F-4517 (FW-2822)]
MASALAKLLTAILGPRQHRKAIIGLDEASGIDLLKRLCGTIKEKKYDEIGWLVYYTGTNSSLKCNFDFVAVEVGGSGGPPPYHQWMVAQFQDADGFIWVVDSADTDRFVESRVEMGYARKGGGLRQGGLDQAELVIADAGDNLDWVYTPSVIKH